MSGFRSAYDSPTLIWCTHGVEQCSISNDGRLVEEGETCQMVLRAHIQLVGTFLQQLRLFSMDTQCRAGPLTRSILGNWKLKYSCLRA